LNVIGSFLNSRLEAGNARRLDPHLEPAGIARL